MHDFESEKNPLANDGAEPLAGSGLEDEKDDGEFISTAEEETEDPEQ